MVFVRLRDPVSVNSNRDKGEPVCTGLGVRGGARTGQERQSPLVPPDDVSLVLNYVDDRHLLPYNQM